MTTPTKIKTPFTSREDHLDHLARVMRDRAYPEFAAAPPPLWATDAAEAILSEFESLYRAAREARADEIDVDLLTKVLAVCPIYWEVRRPGGAYVMTLMLPDAEAAAEHIAREYAKITKSSSSSAAEG